jgi:hypothetical protein
LRSDLAPGYGTCFYGISQLLSPRDVGQILFSLANSIEQEIAFRSWVAEERENKREAKQLGKPYRDLYDVLRQNAKKVDSRAFRSWMNRLGRLWRQVLTLTWRREKGTSPDRPRKKRSEPRGEALSLGFTGSSSSAAGKVQRRG